MNKEYSVGYWKQFVGEVTLDNSSFARFCLPYMEPEGRLLDVCCGNGRDSFYFTRQDMDVYAFDVREIGDLTFNYKMLDLQEDKHNFSFRNILFHYVYCRFVLHSVPERLEDYILINSNNVLLNDGLLFIEARSDKGDIHTGINNHYRRLINYQTLRQKLLNLNFEIVYTSEEKGLSVYNGEDPVLLRVIAKKIGRVHINKVLPYELKYKPTKGRVLEPEDCKYMLLKVKHILEENNIPFFLIFGTLLGAYRNKSFIPWDSDIDIGLFQEDRHKVMKLIESGVFAIYGMIYRSNLLLIFNSLEYKEEYLDFFYYTKKDNLYVCGKSNIDDFQLDLPRTKIEFLGETFETVNDIEYYLFRHYGKNWMYPQRDKHARF